MLIYTTNNRAICMSSFERRYCETLLCHRWTHQTSPRGWTPPSQISHLRGLSSFCVFKKGRVRTRCKRIWMNMNLYFRYILNGCYWYPLQKCFRHPCFTKVSLIPNQFMAPSPSVLTRTCTHTRTQTLALVQGPQIMPPPPCIKAVSTTSVRWN